ncbi:hypothetical protein [Fluviicola sp.]|jgi:hypothetical protein|uniref:hypothetical protein n=1 Tax=Fluviicola sp. TaxID=1917219 RepID=UPI00281A735A|nr:hypothetical protein [Fluviicola sp.]MDR0802843.1 hypothetical protein [Fluviicola sp.]
MSEILDNMSFFAQKNVDLQNLNYPLKFTFKIGTMSNDFVIEDSNSSTLAYVRQKMFKFIDEIQVFTDTSKTNLEFTIKANKWIDFSATYVFTDKNGIEKGRVARKGWASIWKARYDVYDQNQHLAFHIMEENAWTKVFDSIFGEIPVLGIFTGYVFNPKYIIGRPDGSKVMRLKKNASMFGRKFTLDKIGATNNTSEDEYIVLSLMMMILLERRRG